MKWSGRVSEEGTFGLRDLKDEICPATERAEGRALPAEGRQEQRPRGRKRLGGAEEWTGGDEEPDATARRVVKPRSGIWTLFLGPCAVKQESDKA